MPRIGTVELVLFGLVVVAVLIYGIVAMRSDSTSRPNVPKRKTITLTLRRVDPPGAAALTFFIGFSLSVFTNIGAALSSGLIAIGTVFLWAFVVGVLLGIAAEIWIVCFNFFLRLTGGWKFEFERPIPSTEKAEDAPSSTTQGNTPEREAELLRKRHNPKEFV